MCTHCISYQIYVLTVMLVSCSSIALVCLFCSSSIAFSYLARSTKVVTRANKVRPIKLSPDMIIRRGNARSGRVPLCVSPERKRQVAFASKFGKTFIISAVMVCMNFEIIISPNRATFAAISVKLMTVIISGFMGYKFGYENIVNDTVEYIGCQADLMREYLKYVKEEKG